MAPSINLNNPNGQIKEYIMNTVYRHPGQPQMQAQVILASKGPNQDPIYTIRMRYPRIIHAEAKTHRIMPVREALFEPDFALMDDMNMSRNAGSSRARPAKVTIEEVRSTPFIPWHWGKNQSGMQASEECNNLLSLDEYPHWYGQSEAPCNRETAWKVAAETAADIAENFATAGYHKQVFNRLLEPFSWIDVLATSTDWDNFLWLREHEDAEPHIADLARLVKQAIDSCNIQELSPCEWHLPYITKEDLYKIDHEFNDGEHTVVDLAKPVSAARCARISYAPFGSKEPDILSDIHLYQKLIGNARIHASPMEHQATPDWYDPDYPNCYKWDNPELHGNLNGYIQFRKTIPGERWTKGL